MVKIVTIYAMNLVTVVIKHQEHVTTVAKQAGKATFVKSVYRFTYVSQLVLSIYAM